MRKCDYLQKALQISLCLNRVLKGMEGTSDLLNVKSLACGDDLGGRVKGHQKGPPY